MVALLSHLVRGSGADEAIADQRRTLTWAELDARVNRWVRALRAAGLRPADRVAVVSGNRIECLEILLACLHSGLVLVPVNCRLAATEIAHIVSDAGCEVVVSDPERREVTAGAVTGRGVRHLCIEQDLRDADAGEPDAQSCGGLMLYTSGTTGRPRGVISHLFTPGAPIDSVRATLRGARHVVGIPSGRRGLLVCPWYHSAPLYFALMSLLLGNRTRVVDRFEPGEFLDVVGAESIDHCHLVPTQLVRLLRYRASTGRAGDTGSLETVWHGGGACDVETKTAMLAWWGPVLVEYYGATEGGIVAMIDAQQWERHPGSVGRPLPRTTVTIVDSAGRALPPGTRGRVFVERATRAGFEYHNDPSKTRAAHLRPGVYTFGELGHLDDEGYLYLDGRDDDTIVSGGVNIYPAEVVAALLRHPAVVDVAVFARPDAEFGQVAAALVMTEEPDHERLPAVLREHCTGLIAGFKVPRMWWFTRELPRDETGKLRHATIREFTRAHAGRGRLA